MLVPDPQATPTPADDATVVDTVVDAAPAAAATEVAPAEPVALVKPEGLPDAYWDAATGVKPEAFAKLAEFEARRAEIPETAAGYDLGLPDNVVGLDGKPLKVDPEDPLAKSLVEIAHKNGLPKSAVSELVQAYAAVEVAGAKEEAERLSAETAKLGPKASERIAATTATLAAQVGEAEATALMAVLGTAEAYTAVEKLLAKVGGPTIQPAPQRAPTVRDRLATLYPDDVVKEA